METTLTYTNSGLTYSQAVECNRITGLSEPERLHRAAKVHECKDGHIAEQILGFNKRIEVEIRAITTEVERRFLVEWFIHDDDRRIIYGLYNSKVLLDPPELVSEWIYECEHNRQFTLGLIDTRIFLTWADPSPETEGDLFFKNNVLIDSNATVDAPQVLTTNSGVLSVMEDGAPFPSFDATLNDYLVLIKCSHLSGDETQLCVAVFPTAHHVNDVNNMDITFFPGSGYIPALNGELYADFAIWQKAKTV